MKKHTHAHALLWNHIFSLVHEGESWEGLAGGAYRRLLIHGVGDGLERELWVHVADVTRAGLERSDTCKHAARSCDNHPIGSESFPTTLGTNGGLSFRAKRSSQSMGAKKECSCSSAWTQTLKSVPLGFAAFDMHRRSLALLQDHGSPPNAWRRISPTVPARASGQPGWHRRAAARGREGCSRTSLPCSGYKMEAVGKRAKVEGAAAAGGDGE